VPIYRRFLAVPLGAEVAVEITRSSVRETHWVRLVPNQVFAGEISARDELWQAPFAYDRFAYARNTTFPPDICRVEIIGRVRDLRLAVLECAAGQYNPVTQELRLFREMEFSVNFWKGTGSFLPQEAANPFDNGNLEATGLAANAGAVQMPVWHPPGSFAVNGEELLILTHPKYRAAADRLANHKRDSGILTSVYEVNDGTGPGPDTKEQIQAFINQRFHTAFVRPSYVLLLGDAPDIEPWTLPRRYNAETYPSDFPYAQIDTDPLEDYLGAPDLAVGRIAVNSLAEAQVVVDKIIGYEADPPVPTPAFPFYTQTAIASYFQCCAPAPPPGRENNLGFIQTSEWLLGHLRHQAYDVQRIYTTGHDPAYTDDPTPRYYYNGVTPLPQPLRPEDGFPWDGNTAGVVDAFNAGRLFFFHIDHGGGDGWSHPYFTTQHFAGLINGPYYPVVVSGNCSSGAFDLSDAGFAESILRHSGGGAVGVLAFTRDSNSGVIAELMAGFVSALWPEEVPDFGGQRWDRLGDILNRARARIAVGHQMSDPGSEDYQVAWAYVRILNLFGDPTLRVWTENPNTLPGSIPGYWVAGPVLELHYPLDGVIITAVEPTPRGFTPIGRAVVRDGVARLEYAVEPSDFSAVRFFASKPGAVSRALTAPAPCLLDVDLNGEASVATDIVYVARRLLGLPPVPPSFRAIDPSILTDPVIAADIDVLSPRFDVDNNGRVDVATDIVYVARQLLGMVPVPSSFRASDPTIPPDATIAARINALCP
jgi:hypothetical protein